MNNNFELINPSPKSGDALRDLAANLLAQKYGAVKEEKRVSGKKVDIYCESIEFGKRRRWYIEAKDYGKSLERHHLVSIYADYGGILKKNKPAELLIVTRYGVTPDADKFIDENDDLTHLTIWDLENEVLGLANYIKSLSEIYDKEGLSSYYVAGKAKKAFYKENERFLESGVVDLFESVSQWLDSDDFSPMAILGGYGAGKSSFAKRLVSHQARRALGSRLNQPTI